MPNHIGAFLKDLFTEERAELFRLLAPGKWMVFGGHGGKKEYISEALDSKLH